MIRRLVLATGATAAISTAALAEVPTAEAEMMRQTWKSTKETSAQVVQPVFGRVIGFALPRGFVPVWRQQGVGRYIAEYVPDGESIDAWTRMITVTATVGAGAARVEDADLADVFFNKPSCPAWTYRDFGPVAGPGKVRRRDLAIGCDAPAAPIEHGAIALLRDDETVWTVQYAERSRKQPPFAFADAPKMLANLRITACGTAEKGDDCGAATAK